MAGRLAEIAAHVDNVRQLESVVTAMRGIAAARAQQSHALLAGIESYSVVVARAIGEALLLAPQSLGPARGARRKRALIVFCAEGGFCGALSDRVLDAIAAEANECFVFQIGARGASIAEERRMRLDWMTPMPSQVGAVSSTAERIVQALYARIAEGRITHADVIYPRPQEKGGAIAIERLSLLPLDMTKFKIHAAIQPPLVNLPGEILIEQLVTEYVYALLVSATMHAFEAENEARMVAMAAARAHIQDTLKELQMREHQARQEAITSEIVELSASILSR